MNFYRNCVRYLTEGVFYMFSVSCTITDFPGLFSIAMFMDMPMVLGAFCINSMI